VAMIAAMQMKGALLYVAGVLGHCWCLQAQTPVPPTATPTSRFLSLYERIAQREKEEPGYLRRSATEFKEVSNAAWLAAKWKCAVTVFETPTTAERKGGPPEELELERGANGDVFELKRSDDRVTRTAFLFFDPRAHRWVAPMGDAAAWGALTAERWQGTTLVLTGRVSIMGSMTELRQTITKVSERNYTILNEEQAPDGRLVRLDWYDCAKTSN